MPAHKDLSDEATAGRAEAGGQHLQGTPAFRGQPEPAAGQGGCRLSNRRRLSEPMRLPGQAPPWYRASISTRTPTVIIMNGPERFLCAPGETVIPPAPAQSVLATRKPLLLLRLSGWFLLR